MFSCVRYTGIWGCGDMCMKLFQEVQYLVMILFLVVRHPIR